MASLTELKSAIQAELERQLAGVRIVSVEVCPDVDEDGDSVLFVTVVFQTNQKRLDARATSSMARHLRSEICRAGDDRFPVLSFIADNEMKRTNSVTT